MSVIGVTLMICLVTCQGAAPLAAQSGAAAAASPWASRFPNVVLRTQDNREVRFYDDLVKGKLVVISFMFTSCKELCPRGAENLAWVQEALGDRMGRDVFFISISVDPDHDTPAVLNGYAKRFHARAGWVFATGSAADIDLIRRQLGAYDRDSTDRTSHTGMLTYGNDATGSWARMPVTLPPSTITASLLRLVQK
jgi:protein SCO1/2